MESSLFKQAAEFLRERKIWKHALVVLMCLAVIVSIGTVGVLTSTGQAMTHRVKMLVCPAAPHEHTLDCYDAEGNLICAQADYLVHVHNADCYGPDGALSCTLPEIEPHIHDASCYEEMETLVCGLEESDGHEHDESCYTWVQGDLTCTLEEHSHDESCTDAEGNLVCGLEEHIHSEDCYDWTQELTCGLEEGEGAHHHDETCVEISEELVCGKLELHTHDDSCYELDENGERIGYPICGEIELLEHVHDAGCFEEVELTDEEIQALYGVAEEAEPVYICGFEEHIHSDDCYDAEGNIICGYEQHEHDESCLAPEEKEETVYVCGYDEHVHQDSCYNEAGELICGLEQHVHSWNCLPQENAENVESAEAKSGDILFFSVPSGEPICGLEEHSHNESCYDENGELICGLEEHTHDDSCWAAETEPAEPVSICELAEHIHDASCYDENGELICGLPEHTHDETCTLAKSYEDGSVLITATYGVSAGIPDEAELRAYPVTAESDPERYEQRVGEALEALGLADGGEAAPEAVETPAPAETEDYTALVYNIGFFLPDGTEVEPLDTVTLTVQFLGEDGLPTGAQVQIVHFAETGAETIEGTAVNAEGETSFTTESFSDYVFVGGQSDASRSGETAGIMANENEHVTNAKVEGLNKDGNLELGKAYTYSFNFNPGNEGWTMKLPGYAAWEHKSTDITTKIDGKEVKVGTVAVAADGTVTYTPNPSCPAEAYNQVVNKELNLPFTVTSTSSDGMALPGVNTIDFEPRDLAPFVLDAKLTQGNEEIKEGDKVVVGETYHYQVHFKELGTGLEEQFSDPMYFQLPDNVSCEPQQDRPIYDETGKQVGTYDIDENGLVTFDFDEEYLEKNGNIDLNVGFDLTVTGVGEGGGTSLPWEDGKDLTFETDTEPDVELKKIAGDYDPKDPKGPSVNYTVELDVTKGAVNDPVLEDQMKPGLSYREGSGKIVVYEADGKTPVVFPEGKEPKLVPVKDENGVITGWKTEGLPEPLAKGQRVVVEYTSDVDFDKMEATASGGSLNFTAENTANFDGTKPVGGDHITREQNTKKNFTDKRLQKSGNKDTEHPEYPNDLDWEIQVGSGSSDETDSIVTDELQGDHWINKDRPLELKWKDENDSTIKTYSIPWDKAGEYGLVPKYNEAGQIIGFEFDLGKTHGKTIDGEKFWEFTDADGNTRTWQPGDWLKLEYYTTYDPDAVPENGDKSFNNSVKVKADIYPFGITGEVNVGATSASKGVTDLGDYLEYDVAVDIPDWDSFIDIIGDKDKDNDPSRGGIRFYLQDQLQFEDIKFNSEDAADRYFVDNLPVEVEIYAEMIDTGEIVNFTEDGTEPQSFHVARVGRDYTDSDGPMKGSREFQIWFNIFDLNGKNKEDSRWTLTERCRLHVIYKIPTSATLIKESPQGSENYEETDLTLGDLLDQGFTVKNKVEGIGRAERRLTAKNNYKRNQPEGGMLKDAEIVTLPDGSQEIEYRVSFNGFFLDPETGKYNEVAIDPNTFTLVDSFDSRLEYVPGSLQVEVYAPDTRRQRYTFDYKDKDGNPYDPTIVVNGDGTTTMTAEALNFDYRSYSGGSSDDEPDLYEYMWSGSKEAPKPRDALYVFVYKLKLKDESLQATDLKLLNTATVNYNGKSSSDTAEVNFTPNVLDKKSEYKGPVNGRDMMEYTIDVNPGGADMVTVGTEDPTLNPRRYTLTDQMSDQLELDPATIKVVRKNADGTETELERVSDQSLVVPENNYFVFQEADNNSFKLVLPDEQHIVITYSAFINGTTGSSGTAKNSVKLEGGITIEDSDNADYTVQGNSATMSGDTKLRLFKQDAMTGNYMDGAEFEVYTLMDGTGAKLNGTEYGLESYVTVSPDDLDGADIMAKTGYDKTYYLLVEKKAPNGYMAVEEPVVFVFGEPPKGEDGNPNPEMVTLEYQGESYELEVQYVHTGDNVIVIPNTPNAYELPETGGEARAVMMAGVVTLLIGAAMVIAKGRRKTAA